MKRLLCAVVAVILAVALVSCGEKSQTVKYRIEEETEGINIVETMTFEAEGDKIVKMIDEIEVDFSSFDESTAELLVEGFEEMVDSYNSVDGVNCTSNVSGSAFTLKADIDVNGNTVDKLDELGLLTLTGDGENLSLKVTEEGLASSGYEKIS